MRLRCHNIEGQTSLA